MKANSSVGGGVDGGHLDAADTLTLNTSDLNVALITPDGVPGVLDEPVILAVFSAVANGEDGVVTLGAASRTGEDT